MGKNATKQKIIEATTALFASKGFAGTTTKEIAKVAGVNEVTLFRHFGSKNGVFEAIIESLAFDTVFDESFYRHIKWDLEQDIRLFGQTFQDKLLEYRSLIFIAMREADLNPEMKELISTFPKSVKQVMLKYLKEMHEKEQIISTDLEIQAMNFVWMHFGYFLSRVRFEGKMISAGHDDFLDESTRLIARGLRA
ncbi:DNA-binding transcriptional regulator, AcrR family [Terribacillus halophilus]|uniref:DNA-binding transcriptional regulator, AcrR family n=1 Tax=Terribacillus halophilus TaxID=361279 RepID=A0A1G6QS36_9BACI|nr:TetR/AcrR family transcriptional regulator [Terribacillus halophilus]SDC95101.1 DNA-binding transcriptional regulator, AcrR family [Terribacillus halophilus]